MRVIIDEDESYPVYRMLSVMPAASLYLKLPKETEVDDEKVNEWKAVIREYDKVQGEMKRFYNG